MDLASCFLLVGIVAAVVGVILLLKSYMGGGQFRGKERIPGKTVIITGANSGIGKEAAKELARRGGRVILACRDVEKAEEVKVEIKWEAESHNVVVKHLDLASMASIRTFVDDINATEDHVDILINNAGIMFCPKMLTEDGFEMQLGVNHLGHFLLTMLLLDKIKASAPSRIINVSSMAHMMTSMNFEDLNSEKSYNYMFGYRQSKLANILFTRELAKRLENTGVTVNCLHPGVVSTSLLRHSLIHQVMTSRFFAPFFSVVVKTPVQGAQTTLYCALSAELEGVTGKYFSDCAEKEASKESKDEEAAKRLWEISEKMTKLA